MRKNQRRRHERHLFSFDPAIRTKNFRKLLYFSLLLLQTAGTLEEACPYIAKLHPCQEILAYELERISFVGELTSFNTNSTINGQLFAKGEKKILVTPFTLFFNLFVEWCPTFRIIFRRSKQTKSSRRIRRLEVVKPSTEALPPPPSPPFEDFLVVD